MAAGREQYCSYRVPRGFVRGGSKRFPKRMMARLMRRAARLDPDDAPRKRASSGRVW